MMSKAPQPGTQSWAVTPGSTIELRIVSADLVPQLPEREPGARGGRTGRAVVAVVRDLADLARIAPHAARFDALLFVDDFRGDLTAAMTLAAESFSIVPPRIVREIAQFDPRVSLLHEMPLLDLQVFRLVGLGLGNATVGRQLGIDPALAKRVVSRLLRRFGLPNRTRLALFAVSHMATFEAILSERGSGDAKG